MPRGTQVKRDGLAITVDRREHLKWDCPQASKPSPAPYLVCKGPYWRKDCPLRARPQRSDSQGTQDWRRPGAPTQAPILITPGEPWVLITVGGQSVDFLLDTRATSSVLTVAPGPLSSWSTTVMGLSERAKRYYLSHSLSCKWDSVLFPHEFLIMPESPRLSQSLLHTKQMSNKNILYSTGNYSHYVVTALNAVRTIQLLNR